MVKRANIKQAEGIKQAKILQAEGRLSYSFDEEAANKYFTSNAQILKKLETVQKLRRKHQDYCPFESGFS